MTLTRMCDGTGSASKRCRSTTLITRINWPNLRFLKQLWIICYHLSQHSEVLLNILRRLKQTSLFYMQCCGDVNISIFELLVRLRLQLLHEHICGLWIAFFFKRSFLIYLKNFPSLTSTFFRGLMQTCLFLRIFFLFLIKAKQRSGAGAVICNYGQFNNGSSGFATLLHEPLLEGSY